ncbi:hypothetical protein M0R45_016625 [Rubus argutus]|uniref:ATP-dependent RNA helicase DHX37-like C-terminal domain-containing protein n=1 Tax=Rubus argutus TaxID=59490 RepID=A0AAW1XVL3_RUBAR
MRKTSCAELICAGWVDRVAKRTKGINSELKGAVQAFAFALLDGKVLRCLRPVREFMAERPRTVIMPEAADRERVQNLLVKLEEKKIISLAMLRELWKENPNELYPEIRNWFQKSFQKNFKDIWSNMLNEARVKYN